VNRDPQSRPIMFSEFMVRRISEGRKTQTRRPLNWREHEAFECGAPPSCRYGSEGDSLWVRERFRVDEDGRYRFLADEQRGQHRWTAAMFLPRSQSRMDLLIVAAPRVERLREITDEDAFAEGRVDRAAFLAGWELLYKNDADKAGDPLVWVVTFNMTRFSR
jgi:hypothetical protein